MPARNRKLYAGPNADQLLDDYFPANTVEVSGESFHFHELHDIARHLQLKEDKFQQIEAYLRVEPENEFDPNAVAVFIHQTKVGYVNKQDAPEISHGLSQFGGAAWVMAAIKEVTTLPQYRVRLMISRPVQLDFRAFSLIDLTEIMTPQLNEDTSTLSLNVELADILGNFKADELGLDDPTLGLVMIHLESNSKGESEIVTEYANTVISRVLADDHPDLFDAILEVNQAAWTAVRWIFRGDNTPVAMHFVDTKWVLQRHFPEPISHSEPKPDNDEAPF